MTPTNAGLQGGTSPLVLFILVFPDLEGKEVIEATYAHSHGEAFDIAIES